MRPLRELKGPLRAGAAVPALLGLKATSPSSAPTLLLLMREMMTKLMMSRMMMTMLTLAPSSPVPEV